MDPDVMLAPEARVLEQEPRRKRTRRVPVG
jgi:hypothetical protein